MKLWRSEEWTTTRYPCWPFLCRAKTGILSSLDANSAVCSNRVCIDDLALCLVSMKKWGCSESLAVTLLFLPEREFLLVPKSFATLRSTAFHVLSGTFVLLYVVIVDVSDVGRF